MGRKPEPIQTWAGERKAEKLKGETLSIASYSRHIKRFMTHIYCLRGMEAPGRIVSECFQAAKRFQSLERVKNLSSPPFDGEDRFFSRSKL